MKKSAHLELVSGKKNGEIERPHASLKYRVFVGGWTILLAALILMTTLLLPKPTLAAEVYGVNFNAIDWESLCPSIEPISVGNCSVVHPTSSLARRFKSGFEDLALNSKAVNCENQKKIYKRRVSANPLRCALTFKTAYTALVTSSNTSVFTPAKFRDTYLSEGIVNLNALPKSR